MDVRGEYGSQTGDIFMLGKEFFGGMLCLGSKIKKSPHSCCRKVLFPWLGHFQSVK